MIFSAREFNFHFPGPALVMGVVNVTPDSFSDGGRFFAKEAAIDRALKMIAEGAAIIDIGGESTRPGGARVDEPEERRRVLPVIEALAGRAKVVISVDTQKPGVALAAVERGASMINDIGANRCDRTLWRTVAETGAGYVAMHMQGSPQTMQVNPAYTDVVKTVDEFFANRLAGLRAAGVRLEQVILDVGIGFGKTLEHNLALLAGLGQFRKHDRPLLLGVSRKSFIGKLLGVDLGSRLPAGLACACVGRIAGIQLIRTHDVAETVQALRMTEAILAQHNDNGLELLRK